MAESEELLFEELVAARGQAMLRFALMLCGDRHLAEDLVQSALARAYRRRSRLLGAHQPESYLKKMIVNEHLAWWRRRSSRERPTAEHREQPGSDGTAERAERDAVWALLATLPKRQRAVLVLRYYEDLSDEQIASVLGCTPGTVRSNAARALAALRETLRHREVLP